MMQIVDLPMKAPQHRASDDEMRVATCAKVRGYELASLEEKYVLCDDSYRHIYFSGLLSEVEAWLWALDDAGAA